MGWAVGSSPLAGTEGHRAITGHEIVQSGTLRGWLLPTLYGELYLRKPPLHYWTLAAAELLAGRGNEWVWRMPSVLAAAALGAFLCWMAGRWFGQVAGRVSAFAFLALLPLWAQNRSADIDAPHTLAAIVAACALIEIAFGPSRQRWRWAAAGGAALGAAMLLKGPAGFPVILGAMIGPAILNREASGLKRGATWALWLFGAAIFAAWAASAYLMIRALHMAPDLGGLSEVAAQTARNSRRLLGVVALPPILLAYGLPVSLALPLTLRPSLLDRLDRPARQLVRAVGGTILAALGIGLLAAMSNPRYGYVVLPMLAPLAGAAAMAWQKGFISPADQQRLRAILTAATIALVGAAVALTAMVWKETPWPWVIATAAAVSVGVGAWAVWNWLQQRISRAAWGMAWLLVLLAIPFADWKYMDRRQRSAFAAAEVLRQQAGVGATVISGVMVRDQPELFFYAAAVVEPYGQRLLEPFDLPHDGWLVLTGQEWAAWSKAMPGHLTRATRLPTRAPGSWLAWYERQPPAQGGRSSGH